MENNSQKQIAGAIIIAGVFIAGAILLKGDTAPGSKNPEAGGIPVTTLPAEKETDRILGDKRAKVALISYEDFQCPFCGAVSGLVDDSDAIRYLKRIDPSWSPYMTGLKDYIAEGKVKFIFRDWAFLGRESVKSAEATLCAGDAGKFWEYHDYLYSHQNGENKGAFSDANLKNFAGILGLNQTAFDECLDSGKYSQAVADSKDEGARAGVNGTPKGFILKDGKLVGTIEGAESWVRVKQKLDDALK